MLNYSEMQYRVSIRRFTAIEGIAPRAYKGKGGNCVFERCAPSAKPTPKVEAVDPVQVVQSEFTRVKEGLGLSE